MSADNDKTPSLRATLANPVTLIAVLMLLAVITLIGSAMLGIDKGFLFNMARFDFARGLITYLFAVVTIGTAVVLVVAALTNPYTEESAKRLQSGKEVFGLLLGVFGTVMGFYFASESRGTSAPSLQLSTPYVAQDQVVSGQEFTIVAYASGGLVPLRVGATLDPSAELRYENTAREDGWVILKLVAPTTSSAVQREVRISLRDAAGKIVNGSTRILIQPK